VDPETKVEYLAQVAFKVLVRPGAKGGCTCTTCKERWPSAGGAGCKIGQETLRGTRGRRIDPLFDNSELEWYTEEEERGSIVCTGLLVRLVLALGGKAGGSRGGAGRGRGRSRDRESDKSDRDDSGSPKGKRAAISSTGR
jgi:hypothetical protein